MIFFCQFMNILRKNHEILKRTCNEVHKRSQLVFKLYMKVDEMFMNNHEIHQRNCIAAFEQSYNFMESLF